MKFWRWIKNKLYLHKLEYDILMEVSIGYSWPTFRIDREWTLFLDRDGVINTHLPNQYVCNWSQFQFINGVLDALELLTSYFRRIIIVTNQAGIEKGLYTHDDLRAIHDQMMEYIQYHGGRIDEIYYCPYTGDNDPLCRKPNPGMAIQAKKDFPDIDFKRSLMIGDSSSDIAFGNNLGMKTILVGNKSEGYVNAVPDARLSSLSDFAHYIAEL